MRLSLHTRLSVRTCKCWHCGEMGEQPLIMALTACAKRVLDYQISKSSPLCTRLTRHRAKWQKTQITCRDFALLSKRFVVRRLLKTCRVATAEDKHSPEQITNIFQVARLQPGELPTSVSSIFSFALGTADCHVTPQLTQKFGKDKRC